MKKLIGSTALFLCLQLSAQREHEPKFELGILAGTGISSLRGSTVQNNLFGWNIGYITGLSFQYNTRSLLSIRTEAVYERKGAQLEVWISDPSSGTTDKTTAFWNYNYLTIPLLLKFQSEPKQFQFFFETGPYLGFLLAHNFNTPTTLNFYAMSYDYTAYNSTIELGAAAGAGIIYNQSRDLSVSLQFRDHLGLNSVATEKALGAGLKSNAFYYTLGISYRFGNHRPRKTITPVF